MPFWKKGGSHADGEDSGRWTYHIMSRVVDRWYVFGKTVEREIFRKVLRAVEGFSGVRIMDGQDIQDWGKQEV
jgi:hypothetical protein